MASVNSANVVAANNQSAQAAQSLNRPSRQFSGQFFGQSRSPENLAFATLLDKTERRLDKETAKLVNRRSPAEIVTVTGFNVQNGLWEGVTAAGSLRRFRTTRRIDKGAKIAVQTPVIGNVGYGR